MQKYRRWTDEATGVNPFIRAKSETVKLTTIVTSAVIAFIKLNIVAFFILPISLSFLLQNVVQTNKKLAQIANLPIKMLVKLLGLWGPDDNSLINWLNKTNGKGRIILSNSVSILDAFYYISVIPSVRFIVSSPEEDKFRAISGSTTVMSLLSNKQPFFEEEASETGEKFKQLLSRQLARGRTCIIFYEGIRTLGLGTIKISKKLSSQIYNLEKDYCISHLRYTSAPEGLSSLVSHPFILLLIALGTCSISLRVRCNPISIDSQHSQADVQKDVDNFLLANGSKLLETNPSSYFQFLDFYYKSQKGGYTKASQDQNK